MAATHKTGKSGTNNRARHAPRATFALWDLDTGNLVGAYDTEEGALAVVRRSVEEHGRESVAMLALARETPGRIRNVAQGEALVERASRGHTGTRLTSEGAIMPSAAADWRAGRRKGYGSAGSGTRSPAGSASRKSITALMSGTARKAGFSRRVVQ